MVGQIVPAAPPAALNARQLRAQQLQEADRLLQAQQFEDWLPTRPNNPLVAARISKLVMTLGLREGSSPAEVFQRLKQWVRLNTNYATTVIGGLPESLTSRCWNCETLSTLLKVTYCMLRNVNPDHPLRANLREVRLERRRLSVPGIRAALQTLEPNVRRRDNGEMRYSFSAHTYLTIEGHDYDLLMGVRGPGAEREIFPVEMVAVNGADTCAFPGPAGAPPARYWLRRLGPPPIIGPQLFELERV